MVTKVQSISYHAEALRSQCRCGLRNDPTLRSLCPYDGTRLLVPHSACSVLSRPTGHIMNSSDIQYFLSYNFLSQTHIIESVCVFIFAHCSRGLRRRAATVLCRDFQFGSHQRRGYLSSVIGLCCQETADPSYRGLLPNVKYLSAVRCNINPLHLQDAVERTPLFGKLINSKPKKIRQIFFLSFLESTQNAVLHRRVLNKTSLKWRP